MAWFKKEPVDYSLLPLKRFAIYILQKEQPIEIVGHEYGLGEILGRLEKTELAPAGSIIKLTASAIVMKRVCRVFIRVR